MIDEEAYRRLLGAIERGKTEARLAYGGQVGALADEGYYVAPHIFADVLAPVVPGPGGDLRPGSGGAEGEGPGPGACEIANDVRYALTGGLYSRSPGQHRAGEARVPRRQPVHQPQDHRRPGRSPAVWRLQAVGHRLQGGRAGLLVAIRPAPDYHRKYPPTRVRSRCVARRVVTGGGTLLTSPHQGICHATSAPLHRLRLAPAYRPVFRPQPGDCRLQGAQGPRSPGLQRRLQPRRQDAGQRRLRQRGETLGVSFRQADPRSEGQGRQGRPYRGRLLRRLQQGRHSARLGEPGQDDSPVEPRRRQVRSARSRATPTSWTASPSVPTASSSPRPAPTRASGCGTPPTARKPRTSAAHAKSVYAVAFSPDGKLLAVRRGRQPHQDLRRGGDEGAEAAQGPHRCA